MVSPQHSILHTFFLFLLFLIPFYFYPESLTLTGFTENKGKNRLDISLDTSYIDCELHLKSDKSKENSQLDLTAYNLQISPFAFLTVSFGSLQSSGLSAKTRNPLFTLSRTKAPLTTLTPKTILSGSSTKPPHSIGIEIQSDNRRTCAEGILTDGHVSRCWASIEQDFVFFNLAKSYFRIGIFSSFSESHTLKTDSWFLIEKEDCEGSVFDTAIDFSAKLGKATASSTFFLHIPNCGTPAPAIRLQTSVPIPFGSISAGFFSSELIKIKLTASNCMFQYTTFKNSEGKTLSSSVRSYAGTEHTIPLTIFPLSQFKLHTCVAYDKKKPVLWYESGKPQITAGSGLSLTATSTSIGLEYSNIYKSDSIVKDSLLMYTLTQKLDFWFPTIISASLKEGNKLKQCNFNVFLKPCIQLEIKSNTSVDCSQKKFISIEEKISITGKAKIKKMQIHSILSTSISKQKDIPDVSFVIKTIFNP